MSENPKPYGAAASMMPMTKDVQHAGMVENALVCNRCGSRYEMGLPMPIYLLTATLEAWTKHHRDCQGNRSAMREARSVHDWITSDDTGISSKAIWAHMMGRRPSNPTHPWDPADFGRCYRLLALAPEWEARMPEMAKYSDVWGRLGAAWPELKALYEEELPSGTCPKLYQRMKDLIDDRYRDPTQVEAPL